MEVGGIIVKVSQELLSKIENLRIMEQNFDEKDLNNIHLKINNLQIMLVLPDEIEAE